MLVGEILGEGLGEAGWEVARKTGGKEPSVGIVYSEPNFRLSIVSLTPVRISSLILPKTDIHWFGFGDLA